MSAGGTVVAGILPALPSRAIWPVSRRYIAGATLQDAIRTAISLQTRGRLATLDVLGEELESPNHVREIVREYERALDAIQVHVQDATLSIRMSAMGLRVEPGTCAENIRALVVGAKARGLNLTIDMEDSTTKDQTLKTYARLRAQRHDNVGIVLQAYLHDVLADVDRLADLAPRVRVVKGIWREPVRVAYQDAQAIRSNYVRLLDRLLAAGSYVEIATHDEWLIGEALQLLERYGKSPEEYEFQMLLGVTEELGDYLVGLGHRVRVYVPYGKNWYEYSLRRLKENPQIASYVVRDTVEAARTRFRRKA